MTQVAEVMSRGVRTLAPSDTMRNAAKAMDEFDVGIVPVCDGERLVGVVTDRDVTVRGVAQGCSAESTRLDQVMTKDPLWCFDDDPLEQAMETMRDAQIRRLPVVDRARHLVGILSMGDVATTAGTADVAETLACISERA
ncbi:MAG: CBS domain-containing protein [Burkholderiales bacterium]|jgi:CBS domain-containing protein|nr:CBS domain-containing protein [Burkholderiales bacterium]